MAPPPCGPASRSLALLLLACTSCALLLALRRCSGGAPGACPKPQLATVNGALQVRAPRLRWSQSTITVARTGAECSTQGKYQRLGGWCTLSSSGEGMRGGRGH